MQNHHRVAGAGKLLEYPGVFLALAMAVILAPATTLADPFPPVWGGGAVHYAPAQWPVEPADPADCGDSCGNWKPYTRFQNSVNDPRVQDASNGGTAPQNYVNIASSCSDKAQPSIYYYLHQGATAADDVIMFRWRVEQIANTYATGTNPGNFSASNPWSSALWTVLFDIDGSGYRSLAAHLNGSSGSPAESIDMLAGIWSTSPTQSIDYINDPNVYLLGHNPTAFTSGSTILNFNGDAQNPTTSWPNGSSETTWDYGTTRARLISTRSCNEYFVDYQIPVAMLDATGLGGPGITRSTPISMMFCTANSLNNPFQKDCAINRTWAADSNKPAPFGDYISFDKAEPYSQPIVAEVTAIAPATCGLDYQLTARVQDVLAVQNGVVLPSVQAVDFYYWYDADGSGYADDAGGEWVHAASATLVSGSMNTWTANWNASSLPKGRYLIGVQALDDNALVDDGMTPTGVDNRTFSYVAGNASSEVYIDGSWIVLQQIAFPDHSPTQTPSAAENWYGNPDVTGIQTALVGIALNTCGVAPTLGLTANNSEVAPSEAVTFTLTVSNTGNSDAITVAELAAVLPAGFAYTNATTSGNFGTTNPSTSGQTLTWSFGSPVSIAANATATLSFAATASSVSGNYNTTSTAITSFGNLASDPVAVSVGSARLALSISPSTFSTSPSGQVTYTFTYSNPSTVAVSGASLGLTLPANTTFVSCTGSCTGTTNVSWSLSTLDPGESGSVNLVLAVSAAYSTTSLTTSATLSGTDPGSNLVTATASSTLFVNVPVGAIAKFSFGKSASAVRVAPAGSVIYTLSYHNYGDAAASSTVITDTLPAGMVYSSCSNSCTELNGVVTWSLGTVAIGASGTVTVTAAAANPFTYPNPSTNSAAINWTGGTAVDATAYVGVSGDYCSAVFYFRQGADNVLTTIRPASETAPTATSDYTTTLTNISDNTFGSYLTETNQVVFEQDVGLPDSLDISDQTLTISYYLSADQGGGRTQVILRNDTTNTTIATSGELNISTGATALYTFTATVPASTTINAGDKLRWYFQFRAAGGKDITFHYDNLTYDSRSSFCSATNPAYLSVVSQVDQPLIIAGEIPVLTYTLNYSNTGGASATTSVLTHTLPTDFTSCEYSLNNSTWSACSSAGSNPPLHSFALGTIASAGSGTVYVRGTVPGGTTGGSTLTGTASIDSDQTTAETGSAITYVLSSSGGGSTAPALYLSKSANDGLLGAGDTVTYTLAVVNAGDGDATNVMVTDDFPNQSYFSYVSCITATGSCSQSPAGTLSWNVGTLTAGGSATLTYSMLTAATGIPSGLTLLNNSAVASDDDYCTGTLPASCTSNTVTVSVSGNPDLAIDLSANDLTVAPGDVIEYTLIVTNNGSSTASNAVILNSIPNYTGFVAFTLNPAGAGVFDTINNRTVFNMGDLDAGDSVTYTFTVQVISPLSSGDSTITDTATVSASNASSVSDSVSSTATAAPVMSVSMSGPASVPLPATTLAAAATSTTILNVTSAALLSAGDYIRVNGTLARITAIAGNFVTLNSAVTAALNANVFVAATYSLAYQNTGNANASSVVISEPLPSGWVYVTASTTPTSAPSVGSNGTLSWIIGGVNAGASGTRQFVALPTTSGSSTHTATLTAAGSISEQASVTTLVGGLTVTKSIATNSAAAGDSVTYTITLTNSLGSTVNGVVVTDVLPAGFTYVSSTTTPSDASDTSRPVWTVNVAANSSTSIEFVAAISSDAGAATYQNEVEVTAAGVGVTQFDALANTSEDVTLLVGSGLMTGSVKIGNTPLAGAYVNFYDNNVLAYSAYTDANGRFQQVIEAGNNWELRIESVGANNTLLAGLTLETGTDPEAFTISSGASVTRTFVYSFTAPTVNSLLTNDATPVITGTYPSNLAGAVLTITVDAVSYSIGSDLVVSGNTWTLTIPLAAALTDDTYEVSATITVGDTSATDATSNELTVDLTPPVVPTVNSLLTDIMPILTGTATLVSGETLSVTINGATYDNVSVVTGNWTLNTGTATASSGSLGMFDPGMTYSVAAVATDAAGNSSTDVTSSEVEIISNDSDGDTIDDSVDTDDDNDGILDSVEGSADTDGDTIVDRLDLDSDNDGIPDSDEGSADTDADGTPDRLDLDSDNDGIPDAIEASVDTDGDGIIDSRDLDSDNDGLFDLYETGLTDPTLLDLNNDGRIDDTFDFGVNGLADIVELADDFSGDLNYTVADTDGDTVPDFRDLDSDNDGIPDVTETGGSDPDGDGVLGTGIPDVDADGLPIGGGFTPVDSDGDGIPDQRELDADNDGVSDLIEGGGIDANVDGLVDGFTDTDADGFDDGVAVSALPLPDDDGDNIPNFQDNDDADNDGVVDTLDLDDDNDGIPDLLEGDGGVDTDGDGLADSLDFDSDNDGMLDLYESGIADPAALDVDNNGRIDSDFAVGSNGLANIIETSNDSGVINYNGGVAVDTDGDGVADFRDLDSDDDGVFDVIENGGSDPDEDGIIGTGTPDVNTDGIPARGGLEAIDTDADGIPDYRESDSAPIVVVIRTGLKGVGALNNTGLLILLVPVVLARVPRKQLLLLLALLLPGIASANSADGLQRRLYVGAGIGQSVLEPQTDGTVYSVSDDQDVGYRVYVGYDWNSFLSVDFAYSDLGTASLSPTGTIDYVIPSANVLFYFYDQGASDHIGWGAYLKGGIGSIQNDATVAYERVNSLQLAFGGGIEYGWENRVAVRLDLESYDEDASLLTLGVLYRFGTEKKPEPVVIVEPNDADKDGVFDEQDVCPETPQGTIVDTKGCESDADGDGVFDSKDACRGTPVGATVNERGCVPDGDFDGVANVIDQCPNTISGAAVNAVGCAIFETRIEGVNFKTGSAELTDNAKIILDKVAEALASIPTVRVQVQAHTDNVGKEKANQKLSDERARSVVTYLISKDIAAERMESIGYGESQPIADNKTDAGRSQNRRVEFRVIAQ